MNVYSDKKKFVHKLFSSKQDKNNFQIIDFLNDQLQATEKKTRIRKQIEDSELYLDPFRLLESLYSDIPKLYFLYYSNRGKLHGFAIVSFIRLSNNIMVEIDFGATGIAAAKFFKQLEL